MTTQVDPVIEAQAQAIASKLNEDGVGATTSTFLDFIKGLLPVFLQLLPLCAGFLGQKPDTATPSPKEFSEEHYDRSTGTYDRDVVRSMGRTAKKHGKKKHISLNRAQSEKIAVAALEQARLADDETVTAFCAAASAVVEEPAPAAVPAAKPVAGAKTHQ